MRKNNKNAWGAFALGLGLLAVAGMAEAEWVQDGSTLSINGYIDLSNLTFLNGKPFLAYAGTDTVNSKMQIYVMHQDGNNWVQDGGSLNGNTLNSASSPRLAVCGGKLYASWHEENSGNYQGFVKHLESNNWIQDGIVEQGGSYPSLTTLHDTLYIVWQINGQFYVKHLNGGNWTQAGDALNANTNAFHNVMATLNDIPYVALSEWGGSNPINVKHLNGSAWIQDGGNLRSAISAGYATGLAAGNGLLYIAWFEQNGSNSSYYVKHWDGMNWIMDGSPGNGATGDLIVYNNKPYLVVSSGSTREIYCFNNNSWVRDGNFNAANIKLAISNGTLYSVISQYGGTNSQLTINHRVSPTPVPTATPAPVSNWPGGADSAPADFNGSIISANYVYAAPNPIKGSTANIHVFCKQPAHGHIKIFTLLNRELKNIERDFQVGDNTENLYMGDLANGGYFLYVRAKASDGKEERVTTKVLLIK